MDFSLLQVIIAAVLALTTIVYAWYTRMLVTETVRLREAQTEPEIVVYLEPDDYHHNCLNIVVRNIGPGTACNLRWTFDRGAPLIKERADQLLRLRFFDGVSHFAPGQRFVSFLATGPELLKVPIPPALNMRVQFDSRQGKHYTREYLLDPNQLYGQAWVGDQPLKDIARNVEMIHKDLKDMGTRFRRLQVNVFDSYHREEEEQQLQTHLANRPSPQAARSAEEVQVEPQIEGRSED